MDTKLEPNAWRPGLTKQDWQRIELYRRVKAALKADDGHTMRAEMILRQNERAREYRARKRSLIS